MVSGDSVPRAGGVTMLKVSSHVSGSDALSVIASGVSSLVLTLWPVATGASLTAVTVSVTVGALLSSVPSFTLKVKLSAPLKLSAGV